MFIFFCIRAHLLVTQGVVLEVKLPEDNKDLTPVWLERVNIKISLYSVFAATQRWINRGGIKDKYKINYKCIKDEVSA